MRGIGRACKRWWGCLGPGLVTGASGNDPSGIATYAQTGALFGLQQAWAVFYTYPVMAVIQEVCARIGFVTKRGMVGAVSLYYPRSVVIITLFLLTTANLINIGADIGAMGAALQVVFPSLPFWPTILALTIGTAWLTIAVPYKTYTAYLKYLAFTLLVYVPTALAVKIDWSKAFLYTVIPTIRFNTDYIMNVVAVIGTTISPYMFFWQTYQEGEEASAHPARTIADLRCDTWVGMGFSNLISWFIIMTTAGTLFLTDPDGIQTAAEAAQALQPLLGSAASYLFALGVIGTALLAIPVLAATIAQAWCEFFDVRAGLSYTYRQARTFYRVFVVCILCGVLINLVPLSPIDMLYYTAVLNGVLSAPLLWFIAGIAQDTRILSEHVCGKIYRVIALFGSAVLSVATIALLYMYIRAI